MAWPCAKDTGASWEGLPVASLWQYEHQNSWRWPWVISHWIKWPEALPGAPRPQCAAPLCSRISPQSPVTHQQLSTRPILPFSFQYLFSWPSRTQGSPGLPATSLLPPSSSPLLSLLPLLKLFGLEAPGCDPFPPSPPACSPLGIAQTHRFMLVNK